MIDKRVALITGSRRGIGLGIARKLAGEGYALAINDLCPESDVQPVLDELRAAQTDVLYCQADIANAKERSAMLDSIRNQFGRLDVLVNNAGVAPKERKDILDADEKGYDWLMNINLKGPYFLTQAVARWMIEQSNAGAEHLCIVNISSISATVASVNRGDYCISKAGVAMTTRLWATRLAEFGIDVFEIRPGIIATDMTAGVKKKYDKLLAEGLTLQPRWGVPEDIGSAVAMLARGDLRYATGQVLVIDGGLTAQRL